MKKLLFFLLLLLAGNTGFAQDYAPLPDTGIRRYFTNSAGYLRGIRVDSVVQEAGYKRYVTFRTARGRGNNFYDFTDSTGACWLGKNVRAYSSGDWQFPNHAGDTIFIKATASVGASWAFYTDTSSRWFEATILSLDTQTVFGMLDSVKIIELTAKVGNTPLPADPITGFRIVVSKKYGFTQVPDLYLFPYRELTLPNLTHDTWYRYLSLPNGGAASFSTLTFKNITGWNPTEQEMFNCNEGDVFRNRKKGQSSFGMTWDSLSPDSVLEKQVYPDSVNYIFNHWQPRIAVGTKTSVPNGGDVITTKKRLVFDTLRMPEEYSSCNYPRRYSIDALYILPNDTTFCSSETAYIFIRGIYCGLQFDIFSQLPPLKYKKGLGVVYSYQFNGDGAYDENSLYSYRKGSLTCGDLLSVKSRMKAVSSYRLYPHPATTQVFLETPGLHYPAIIHIQNLQGQLLSTQELQSAGKPISTVNLPAGLYLLSVRDAGGNSAVQKLLIEAR